MDKPVEILLFEFLTEQVNAALPDDLISGLELHDTVYQSIRKDRGLRISDVTSTFSPTSIGTEKEYDALITIAAYSRVTGKDKTERIPAMQDAFEIQQKVYELLRNNSTLAGRVCDLLLRRGARGYDVLDGEPFAVAMIPLVINPSGARFQETNYE